MAVSSASCSVNHASSTAISKASFTSVLPTTIHRLQNLGQGDALRNRGRTVTAQEGEPVPSRPYPYVFLMPQYRVLNGIIAPSWRMDARLIRRRRAMTDLIYLALGVLFFVLMGAYASACNRL